mgnify:CR=1 FL=1
MRLDPSFFECPARKIITGPLQIIEEGIYLARATSMPYHIITAIGFLQDLDRDRLNNDLI